MRVVCSFLTCTLFAGSIHAQPAKVVVQPDRIVLTGPDSRHGLLVTAIADDGSTRDVTREAKFASQSDVVQVSANGECTAKKDGDAITEAFAAISTP